MNYGRLLGKLEAIVATGMPGLYRVIAFVAVQKIYSLPDLGRAASAFSVAQILGFFTAIGWASLILVRVPTAKNRVERIGCFYELVRMAGSTLLVSSIGVLLWTKMFDSGASGIDIVVVMIGWTFYQVTRHYFLSLRTYRRVIAYDISLLATTGACLMASRGLGKPAALGLGTALAVTGVIMLFSIGLPHKMRIRGPFEIKGVEFGFTNFLSGGVALSLVPIANYTDGPQFAGIISLVASFSAISALIPRAISMYRLPELSKLVSSRECLATLTSQTAREIAMSCIGAFLVNVAIVLALVAYQGSVDHFWYASFCGIALCAQGCMSMLGMAHSSVLMVREESRESMLINFVACGLFVAALGVCYAIQGVFSFAYVLTACITVTIIRNSMLKRRSTPFLAPIVHAD